VQGARPLGEHAGRDGGGVPCSLQGKHRKIPSRLNVVVGINAWTNLLCIHQNKMSSSKNMELSRDFAAGVYQSL
jgi:hypothetical protein